MSECKSIIKTQPQEFSTHLVVLRPSESKMLSGNCRLVLDQGNFEISDVSDKDIEIKSLEEDMSSFKEYLSLLGVKEPCVQQMFYIHNQSFWIIAGEKGCHVVLLYPIIRRKDWGIPETEKIF